MKLYETKVQRSQFFLPKDSSQISDASFCNRALIGF